MVTMYSAGLVVCGEELFPAIKLAGFPTFPAEALSSSVRAKVGRVALSLGFIKCFLGNMGAEHSLFLSCTYDQCNFGTPSLLFYGLSLFSTYFPVLDTVWYLAFVCFVSCVCPVSLYLLCSYARMQNTSQVYSDVHKS